MIIVFGDVLNSKKTPTPVETIKIAIATRHAIVIELHTVWMENRGHETVGGVFGSLSQGDRSTFDPQTHIDYSGHRLTNENTQRSPPQQHTKEILDVCFSSLRKLDNDLKITTIGNNRKSSSYHYHLNSSTTKWYGATKSQTRLYSGA